MLTQIEHRWMVEARSESAFEFSVCGIERAALTMIAASQSSA